MEAEKLVLKGLSSSEVKKRQQQYGLNEITRENKTSAIKIFL